MKKLLSLTAATVATLALVGCSQDGVVNEAPSANQAIEFGTYLGRDAQTQTRVAAATLATVQTDGFGVYAYYTKDKDFNSTTDTNPNFMKNQKVTWDTNTNAWTYTPVKYWPNNTYENNTYDKVTFLAYTPYDSANSTAANFSINFEVKSTTAEQKDLLYADALENQTKQALTEKVTFNFKHALSRIGFTVQGAIDKTEPGGELATGTTITVNKVMLSGATHTYSNGVATPSTTHAFHKSGVLNILDGSWSEKSIGKLLFTLDSDNFVDTDDNTSGTQFVLKGKQDAPKDLTNADSYLMIIPQTFNTSDGAEANTDNLYVYVEYTVTTKDDVNPDNSSTITNYISTPVDIDFLAGKAYNINLVLGMNSVDLAASVAEWVTDENPVTNEKVDLPANN